MRQRGFSLLEVSIAAASFVAVMGTVAASIVIDTRTHDAIVKQLGPEMKLSVALHRMVTEIRMAGVWGEDKNHNGALDDGEDINANGVLDADWSLADNASASSLTFNIRQDDISHDGTILATGIYSTKVTWALEGGRLVRKQSRYDVKGREYVNSSMMADRLASLTFTRTGGVIRIRAEVDVPAAGGKSIRHATETDVWLRN